MNPKHANHIKIVSPILIMLTAALFVLAVSLACNSPGSEDVTNTQIALNVRTMIQELFA